MWKPSFRVYENALSLEDYHKEEMRKKSHMQQVPKDKAFIFVFKIYYMD